MKTRIRQGFTFVILTILMILTGVFSSFASSNGALDETDGSVISGWAVDTENPDKSVSVTLYVYTDGTTEAKELAKVTADQYRNDLTGAEGGRHGFSYSADWNALEGTSFQVEAYADTADGPKRLYGTSRYRKEVVIPPLMESESPVQSPADPAASKTADQAAEEETVQAASKPADPAASKPDDLAASKPTDPAASKPTEQNPAEQAAKSAAGKSADESTATGPAAEILGLTAPSKTGTRGEYLGRFSATAYCSCPECSSGFGLTYSGTVPRANHTISADISRYPIGTKLMIGDIIYTVEDIGSSIYGNRLDIYFDSHQEALAFGLQQVDVYAVH